MGEGQRGDVEQIRVCEVLRGMFPELAYETPSAVRKLLKRGIGNFVLHWSGIVMK